MTERNKSFTYDELLRYKELGYKMNRTFEEKQELDRLYEKWKGTLQ